MSTSILSIKPEQIDHTKKRGQYKVSIIGCGRNGVLHACLFAEAGFKVICVDSNRVRVRRIARGRTPFLKNEIKPLLKKHVKNGRLKATNDAGEAVAQSDVIVITTQIKFDKKRRVDYLEIEKACKQVGSSLQRGSLVIVMTTVGPGITQGLIKETLEDTSGFKVAVHFGLAYSPIQILNEPTLERLTGCKRIVAAADSNSLNAASTVLKSITKNDVIRTSAIKAAEATKLFESVQHYVNIALANELACFCEKAGIDYFQAQEFAEASAYGTFVQPTLTSGNMYEEPHLLLEEAENSNIKLRIPQVAKDINQEILKHTVSLIKEALRSCGKSLRRAKISLIGVSRTRNTKDIPKASAKKLAETLKTKGAKVRFYDPYLSGKKLIDSGYHFNRRLKDAMEGVDCLVILTGHSRFKRLSLKRLKILGSMPVAVVDLEGILDPKKVEMKGFIYRGLGRGVWTK